MKVNDFLIGSCDSRLSGGVIALQPTASSGTGSRHDDVATPADLLTDLDAAQRALAAQLDYLRAADTQHLHGDIIGQGGAKLLQLSKLRDQLVSGANGVPSAALRASVASALADIRAYTSEARNAASAANGSATEQSTSLTLATASEDARKAATGFMDDYYKRHIFDKYLEFTSAKDEEDFRRREAERQAAIEKALAENTPEGNLRAIRLERDQLRDAGAHGAERSPEFKKLDDDLAKRENALSGCLAKPYKNETQAKADPLAGLQPAADVPPEVLASLRNSGLVMPNQDGLGHGVTVNDGQPASLSRSG
ncbi:MAG: hypothetical protein JSR60_18575 [Proteobacteria bacterium]|nr:hypothetical protein [Pseudomonadota bacterium]